MMMAQVLGELRKAMEDIASFNRIVWDEVTQTCKEESVRISNSFRVRTEAQLAQSAEAHGLPDSGGLQMSPASQQSSKGQTGRAGCQSTTEADMEAGPAEQARRSLGSSMLQARDGAVEHADHARHGRKVQNTTNGESCRVSQLYGSKGCSEHSLAGDSTSQRQRPAGPQPESQTDGKIGSQQLPQGRLSIRLLHLLNKLPY